MNKKWLENVLYFTPFYEEIKFAELFHEEDGDWYYSSDLLNISSEYLESDNLKDAKQEVEDLLGRHLEDEISYYQSLLNSFKS